MRARWAVALTAVLTAVVGAGGGAAWATDPVQLGSGRVFDDVDVLTASEEAQAEERIAQLRSDAGLDLWVVYVDEFTNPSDAENWANSTADLNDLGPISTCSPSRPRVAACTCPDTPRGL